MDGSSGDITNIDSNILSIRDLDITPEMMRLFLPKVNWDRLASMYVPRHSGAECQTRYFNICINYRESFVVIYYIHVYKI